MPLPTFFNLPLEKQQTLLNIAIEEFATHDYESASISRVVVLSGIAKGSFYQYFSNKQDLYFYLLKVAAEKKQDFLSHSSPPTNTDLFGQLQWLFQEMAKFQILYPKLAQIGYRAVKNNMPLPENVLEEASVSSRKYFTQLFDEGKNRGEVNADIDSEVAAFIFVAALTEMTPFLNSKMGLQKEEIIDEFEHEIPMKEVEELFKKVIEVLRLGISPLKNRERINQ